MATTGNVHPYVFKQASVGVRTQRIYINSYRHLSMQWNCVFVVVISTYYHVGYC